MTTPLLRLPWRDALHPWKLWLWWFRRPEIEQHFASAAPAPYDLGEILIKTRTGVDLKSPARLAVYRHATPAPVETGPESGTRSATASAEKPGKPDGWIAGGEALGLYGANVAEKFLAVDGHVYETMERLGADRIDSISDLSQTLGSWEHSVWTGIDPGGLSKFAGHLGEVYAAEHLTAAGVPAEWPDASNQPAWDLLVAGHEVNVKTVTDVAGLRQHFALHPDTPVIVPGDMGNIPADAYYLYPGDGVDEALKRYLDTHGDHAVIVDPGLSHEEVFGQTADAADVAIAGPAVIEAQIPWITIATSGWREVVLLREGKTAAVSAIENLGIDVTVRGGSALGGGKLGAAIGAVFGGPLGSMILGVAGAAAGAWFGSRLAIQFRQRHLNRAWTALEHANQALLTRSAELQSEAARSYASVRAAEEGLLKEAAYREKRALADELARLKSVLEGSGTMASAQAVAVIDEALAEVHRALGEIRHLLDQYNPLRRVLWPTTGLIGLELAERHCRDVQRALEKLRESVARTSGECRRSQVHGALAQFGLSRTRVMADVGAIEDQRRLQEAHTREYFDGMYRRLASRRTEACQRLGREIQRLSRDIKESLAPLVAVCSQRAEAVSVEAGKLGLSRSTT